MGQDCRDRWYKNTKRMHFPVQRIGKKFKEEVGAGIFREIRDQVVYTTQACIEWNRKVAKVLRYICKIEDERDKVYYLSKKLCVQSILNCIIWLVFLNVIICVYDIENIFLISPPLILPIVQGNGVEAKLR